MLIPLTAMLLSIKILLYGRSNYFIGLVQVDDLPGHKMFEVFGEAVPQLIINIVYVSCNYEFLRDYDKLFDAQPMPTSIISAIFSFGTLVIAVLQSCTYWCPCTGYNDDYNEDHENEGGEELEQEQAAMV